MARDPVAARAELQLGLHLVAEFLAVGAARMEAAPRRRVDRARHISLQDDPLLLTIRIRDRNRREKRPGIGVLGIPVNRLAIGDLHDFAQVHDRYAVADVFDHPKIVRDEKIGEVHLLLELLEKIDDLRLDRNVQRGDRLIGDDEFRVHGQCPGDADPLALAAAELVGITIVVLFPETDLIEQFHHPLSLLLPLGDVVDLQPLADDLAHPHARIERGIRVLKDDLHLPAHVAELALGERQDIFPLEVDLAGRRLDQPQDGPAQGGFPASRLSHQPESLPLFDCQADPVDGPDLPLVPGKQPRTHGKILLQVMDLKQTHNSSSQQRSYQPSAKRFWLKADR